MYALSTTSNQVRTLYIVFRTPRTWLLAIAFDLSLISVRSSESSVPSKARACHLLTRSYLTFATLNAPSTLIKYQRVALSDRVGRRKSYDILCTDTDGARETPRSTDNIDEEILLSDVFGTRRPRTTLKRLAWR